MNIDEIQTSAPLEFRAVDDETKAVREFHFIDLIHYNGNLPDFTQWHHVDQFTGYTDKDGKKIFGGDVFSIHIVFSEKNRHKVYFLIEWNLEEGQWYRRDVRDNKRYLFTKEDVKRGHFIGNIHNLDALPEDVRRLLDESL